MPVNSIPIMCCSKNLQAGLGFTVRVQCQGLVLIYITWCIYLNIYTHTYLESTVFHSSPLFAQLPKMGHTVAHLTNATWKLYIWKLQLTKEVTSHGLCQLGSSWPVVHQTFLKLYQMLIDATQISKANHSFCVLSNNKWRIVYFSCFGHELTHCFHEHSIDFS